MLVRVRGEDIVLTRHPLQRSSHQEVWETPTAVCSSRVPGLEGIFHVGEGSNCCLMYSTCLDPSQLESCLRCNKSDLKENM